MYYDNLYNQYYNINKFNYIGFNEGLSTGGMLLNYLYNNYQCNYKNIDISLILIYIVHWFMSFKYHFLENDFNNIHLMSDLLLIDLLTTERLCHMFNNTYISILFGIIPSLLILLLNNKNICSKYFLSIKGFISYLLIYYKYKQHSYNVIYYSILSFSYYIIGLLFKSIESHSISSLMHIIFHYYLSLKAYYETNLYDNSYHESGDLFFVTRYINYFLVLIVYSKHILDMKTYSLKGVYTTFTALVLTPFSIYEIYRYVYLNENNTYIFERKASLFYITFTIMDYIIGLLYYKEYFSLLEGHIHHIMTCLFVYYNIITNNIMLTSVGFIVEAPTILLNIDRIFPDNIYAKYLRRKVFPYAFFIFRIFVLSLLYLISNSRGQLNIYIKISFMLFTAVNIYWFNKMYSKLKIN